MKVDLASIQKNTTCTLAGLARDSGVTRAYLYKLKEKGEVPDWLYYKLHKIYPEIFPLPEDFLDYTTTIIRINMLIYGKKIEDIADVLGIHPTTVHHRFWNNKLWYDCKDSLNKIFPILYVPCYKNETNDYVDFRNVIGCEIETEGDTSVAEDFNNISVL